MQAACYSVMQSDLFKNYVTASRSVREGGKNDYAAPQLLDTTHRTTEDVATMRGFTNVKRAARTVFLGDTTTWHGDGRSGGGTVALANNDAGSSHPDEDEEHGGHLACWHRTDDIVAARDGVVDDGHDDGYYPASGTPTTVSSARERAPTARAQVCTMLEPREVHVDDSMARHVRHYNVSGQSLSCASWQR